MSKESAAREALWYGVPLKNVLQDAIARNNTGYSYAELKNVIASGDDALEDDEIEQVDKTVNLLLHMFVFYHNPEAAPPESKQ